MAQCAKYRFFQEGYSLTSQLCSSDISCLAGIFYILFFFPLFFLRLLAIYCGGAWMNLEGPWGVVRGKDISFLFPLFICQFSVSCNCEWPFPRMRTSRVLVKRQQRSLRVGFNSKSAICQVRSTPRIRRWLGWESSLHAPQQEQQPMAEGAYFKVWTSEYGRQAGHRTLAAYCGEAASVSSGWETGKTAIPGHTDTIQTPPNQLAWMFSFEHTCA